jgi:hypothetical protein
LNLHFGELAFYQIDNEGVDHWRGTGKSPERRTNMAWIRTFEENEARGLLTWVYRVARWTQGRIPNIVKLSSLNPRVLVALGPLYRTLMEGPSPLSCAQRKMVAIVASKVNNCFY